MIFNLNFSRVPVSPVSPVWSITVCGLRRASDGASVRGTLMGLQPAPPLCHQKGAVWQEHRKAAGPMSSGHHSLRQSPAARQKYGLCWAVLVFSLCRVCMLTVSLEICHPVRLVSAGAVVAEAAPWALQQNESRCRQWHPIGCSQR